MLLLRNADDWHLLLLQSRQLSWKKQGLSSEMALPYPKASLRVRAARLKALFPGQVTGAGA